MHKEINKINNFKSYYHSWVILSLEESVQQLINEGKGDIGRLEHILSTIKKGHSLYTSDKEYLEKLQAESRTIKNIEQSNENPEESKSEDTGSKDMIESEIHSDDTTSKQPTEIEILRKEIHKLQDRNHVIEEHLRNGGNQKSRSVARAFGRGFVAIFLFLFGLGMILLLYYHFDNIDNTMRGMYYGGDPWAVMIVAFVIAPAILLGIGGTSIYYGIKIISNN